MLYKVPITIHLDGFAWIEEDVLTNEFSTSSAAQIQLQNKQVRCVVVKELRVENNPWLHLRRWGAEPVESGQLPHVVRGMKLIKRREL